MNIFYILRSYYNRLKIFNISQVKYANNCMVWERYEEDLVPSCKMAYKGGNIDPFGFKSFLQELSEKIQGLWRPNVHSDVVFLSFGVGSSYHCEKALNCPSINREHELSLREKIHESYLQYWLHPEFIKTYYKVWQYTIKHDIFRLYHKRLHPT